MDYKNIIFVLSMIFNFAYQYSIFLYASNLLKDSTRNKAVFLTLASINTVLLYFYQAYEVHFSILIVVILVVLSIEFKLISNTDIIQIFCGASIFTLHISSFVVPMTMIYGNIVNLGPNEILINQFSSSLIIIAACSFLMIAQQIVKKYLDFESIQRVTVNSKYSKLLSISIVLILVLQISFAILMIREKIFPEQILLSIGISVCSLIIFYLFFVYVIKLMNANMYKRYSDHAKTEQGKILEQKEELKKKVERDDLTGVFNRRYVLSLLEKICIESNDELYYVLFVDVNALKYTNDNFGHEAGDRLITKIANGISGAIREDDIIARIGGDEFLVIIKDLNDEDCGNIIDRIYSNFEQANETEEFQVSASIGCVFVSKDVKAQGLNYILSAADEDMRENKKQFYLNQKEEQ